MANSKGRKKQNQTPTTKATLRLLRNGAPASQKTVAVVCLTLLLASAIAMGGAVKGGWFGAKPATASPNPQGGPLNLSKEYIYGPGSRILATEEPPGGGGCTPPASPGNTLVASATSSNSIRLTWNLSSGADHYEVQRKQSIGASWATVGTSTDGQFDDTVGVLADTTYLYQVLAVDASGLCPSVPSGAWRNLFVHFRQEGDGLCKST